MKRAAGTGALMQRENSTGAVWVGQWRSDGKLVRRTIGPVRKKGARSGLTQTDANRELSRLIVEHKPAAPTPATSVTTVIEAGEGMVAEITRLGRKRATISDYNSLLKMHLSPFFREMALGEATRDDVKRFIDFMRDGGGTGLIKSPKSVHNAVKCLHAIFEYGQREGLCAANPVRQVRRATQHTDPDIRFLSQDELEAVLRAIPDDYLGQVELVLYRVAAMTGLRAGELAGLRWRDIDWTASKVRVRQAFVHGEMQSPKSRRGERAVPMVTRVAQELDRLSQSSPYDGDDDLVFAHPHTGRPIDRSKLSKRWRTTAKAAGVYTDDRQVRFHDLRHTFATRMAAQGVPMRTLQEWMGHRDLKTTLIYADYSPGADELTWAEAAFAVLSA